jgi:hypothetical protein
LCFNEKIKWIHLQKEFSNGLIYHVKNLSNAIHRDKEEKGDRETASPNGSQMQNHTIKV